MLLVTGGAGYVGSHTLRALKERGEKLVVLDDLSEGHESAVSGASLVRADLAEPSVGRVLDEIFSRGRFDAVLHFGAKAYVGESVRDPEKYYRNNVTGGVHLLAAMGRNRVSALIFSSTCAIYGSPERVPIPEDHPQNPINPYGRTKLAFEGALKDFEGAAGIRHVNLRYFNAAGAHESGDLGEDHRPETHLIPLAIEAAMGKGEELPVFGDDYDTPDGTCIRDYIHVQDLAVAHVASLDRLRRGGSSASYNLGTGTGHSVLEVIERVSKVSGRKVPHRVVARRPGDPARLVASAERARDELGFAPRFRDLDRIVETAWHFKERFPDGYPD
ncbi:MAG: UDP-glucose 4-epimerase GalE [Vicinamibacteria bacterium]